MSPDPETALPPPPLRIPPLLTEVNRPFWTGGLTGRLLIAHCATCGYWNHPAAPVCRRCLSRDLAPEPVSGKGTVATYTVNYQQWSPQVAPTPYVIALVELAEQAGLRQPTNIVNVAPGDVRIGMPVRVLFERVDDVAVPLFEPDPGAVQPDAVQPGAMLPETGQAAL
jgi:uncharacterized OB-fold protein